MENSTYVMAFILTEFKNMGTNKDIYFCFALFGYLSTVILNLSLIVLIYLEKRLHKPMYIFLCNLLFSALIGSTSFYIKFMIDLRSDSQVISRSACFTQIFFTYMYLAAEITILTVIAYDRYIAINVPLQYTVIISSTKVKQLISVAWLYPILIITAAVFLTAQLPLCSNKINKVLCSNLVIVKLSCIDTSQYNIYSFLICFTFLAPVFFILFSYVKILWVCWNLSRLQKYKAFQTCLPHLVTLLLFLSSVFFEMIEGRFVVNITSSIFSHLASLESLLIPPLLNPLIYGMILPELRTRLIYIFSLKRFF